MKNQTKHPQLNRKQPKYNEDQAVPVKVVESYNSKLNQHNIIPKMTTSPKYQCNNMVKFGVPETEYFRNINKETGKLYGKYLRWNGFTYEEKPNIFQKFINFFRK